MQAGWIRRCAGGWLLAMTLLAAGCATPTRMAFEKDDDTVPNTEAVYLMTATLRNTYHTSFQPRLVVVHVEKEGAQERADRINFTMDAKAKRAETDSAESGSSYLLRMPLPPGKYVIRGMSARGSSFPIHGYFFAPMHTPLEVTKTGVYYLGHVSAVVREREGNEFRAGPAVPLIDQAIAGASGGTFEMEFADRFEADQPMFRASLPALGQVPIQKAVLPPFDRANAQKWWDEH